MSDELTVVPERGLLTTSDEVWSLAVRRAEVISQLAGRSCKGGEQERVAECFGPNHGVVLGYTPTPHVRPMENGVRIGLVVAFLDACPSCS